MSDETPPDKKTSLLRRLIPSTIAGKSAGCAALALVLILAVVWLLRLFGEQSVRVSHAVTTTHVVVEFALVVLIPIVLYWGIRRWNQIIEGEFPDIDRAWESGLNALRAKGVSPTDYPIFLVLGSAGHQIEQGLMDALDTDLVIHGVPEAAGVSHPLQWYMSSDAIYLFCPDASSLSALMGRWSTPSMNSGPRRSLVPTSEPTTGAASAAAGVSANDPVGAPKIERRSPANPSSATSQSAGPGSSAAGPTASATPKPLSKESPLRPAPQTAQPESYLGTIQQNVFDPAPGMRPPGAGSIGNNPLKSNPLRSNKLAGSGAAPQSKSPFEMPPTAPPSNTPSNAPAAGEPLRPAPNYQGTISFDQFPKETANASAPSDQPSPSVPPAAASPAAASPAAASPTTTTAEHPPARDSSVQSETSSATKRPTNAAVAMPRKNGNKKVALPAALDTSHQTPRLRYVCKLLRRSRRPMCGINGIVTLLPFELSRVGPLQLSAISQSARDDVATVQETLGIRSPVTAVLVGLEQDKGFIELVRRLQSGLLSRRLGGRFDLRSRPTPEELNTHSDRLCDAFEDWVYRLFRREDGLEQQRGNRKLYSLTCKIRHELKPRLRIVLGQAFGCDPGDEANQGNSDDSFFFSGCYFAASGATTGQPAFVKGVLNDKLLDEQSRVQWTEDSMKRHWLFKFFAVLGWIIALVLLAVIVIRQFGSN